MAHEINNPLANISLYAQLILRKFEQKDGYDNEVDESRSFDLNIVQKVEIINEQADRAAKIVRNWNYLIRINMTSC
ncbi:MAG: hypothetical protein E4G94_07390 [ANME-2 cluster archaeon]|nr:MAG: hypothetical protein E4G94_07390 [ANME-2 cluster archaeon]